MVQWMLRDMLDLDVMTVTGKTLGENLRICRRTTGSTGTWGIWPTTA